MKPCGRDLTISQKCSIVDNGIKQIRKRVTNEKVVLAVAHAENENEFRENHLAYRTL